MNYRFRRQTIFLAFLGLSFLLIPLSPVFAENIFEVSGPFNFSSVWGWGSFTVPDRIALKYTPDKNQSVCTVKHMMNRNAFTNDNIILSVYSGGSKPETGFLISTQSLPASSIPIGNGIFVYFNLTPCQTLTAGADYWFVLTRTQLVYPYGYYYHLKYVDEYSNLSVWTYYVGNWSERTGIEISFGLEGTNLPSTKEPVIIVPGILGSRLNRVSDNVEVWPDIVSMIRPGSDLYLNDLILSDSGHQIPGKEMFASSVINDLGINTGPMVVYGKLTDYFRNHGYTENTDLFIFPYDWRLDISDSISSLDLVIQQALANSPTGKINIIAHSMGGLLVKKYLSQKNDTSFLNKTILVGVPQLGAPKAFKELNWGDDFGFKIIGLGLNQNKAKEIGQNMPAVYELLPSKKYFEQNGGGYVRDFRKENKTLNFSETNQFLTSDESLADHRNEALIQTADAFHDEIDNQRINAPDIVNIVGCRVPTTIGNFRIYDNGNIDITPINGDGTVPVISALGGNTYSSESYFALGGETDSSHLGLIKNDKILTLINNVINEATGPLPNGISQVIGDCFSGSPSGTKMLAISTHSPVILHVYDPSNNHLGPNPTGDIDVNIPGSDYEIIGENHFAFVPAGVLYRVEIDAVATGSFDLKIKSYIGNTPIESVVYSDIAIENSNLKAKMNVVEISQNLQLNIDKDGDNINDKIITPSSGTNGLSVDDAIPPDVQIISPQNISYLRSDALPITVSAVDVDSGIGILKFKLDGIEIASNSMNIDLFYQKLGSHSFEIFIFDKAGNPATKKVNFFIIASVDSTFSDIERAYGLGWIKNKNTRNTLEQGLKSIVRIETRIDKIEEKLSGRPAVIKTITRLERKIDKVLTRLLLQKLEKEYNKGNINQTAYALIKEDIEWILNH